MVVSQLEKGEDNATCCRDKALRTPLSVQATSPCPSSVSVGYWQSDGRQTLQTAVVIIEQRRVDLVALFAWHTTDERSVYRSIQLQCQHRQNFGIKRLCLSKAHSSGNSSGGGWLLESSPHDHIALYSGQCNQCMCIAAMSISTHCCCCSPLFLLLWLRGRLGFLRRRGGACCWLGCLFLSKPHYWNAKIHKAVTGIGCSYACGREGGRERICVYVCELCKGCLPACLPAYL